MKNPIVHNGDIIEIDNPPFEPWKAEVTNARGQTLIVRRRGERYGANTVYKRMASYHILYTAKEVQRYTKMETKKGSTVLKQHDNYV